MSKIPSANCAALETSIFDNHSISIKQPSRCLSSRVTPLIPNSDIPDLAGKTYLVTGGSSGIGFGICAHLIQHGARILLLSNKEEHAKEAIEDLKEWGSENQIQWIQCDLANLKQTEEVAQKILKLESSGLNGLIFNAGVGVGKYWETVDGLDSHFQVNWLSQLHLTLRLMDLIKMHPGTRIVYQSSDMHRAPDSNTQFQTVEEINQDIGPMNLYNRSKLAQILGTLAIQRRIETGNDPILRVTTADKIFVNATHPGVIETPQQEQAIEAYGTLGKIGVAVVRPFMNDPVKKGCRSALFAATSPDIETHAITGKYITPPKTITSPSSKAQDQVLQDRLWSLSLELLKQKLPSVYEDTIPE